MQGIQNTNVSHSQQVSGHSGGAAAAQQGSFKGAAVMHAPQGQLLPSNMEEVAMFRQNFKSLSNRKTGKKPGADQARQGKQVSTAKAMQNSAEEAGMMASKFKDQKEIKKAQREQVGARSGELGGQSTSQLFKKVPDLNHQKVAEFIRSALAGPPGDPEELLNGMMSKFRDVTHKYLGLLEFKDQVGAELERFSKVKGGESERLGFLSKLNILLNGHLKEIVNQSGPEVRAGLNMTEIAMQFAMGTRGASTDQLREFYRDYVMNYSAMFEAYKKILQRFKKGGFKRGKKFLQEALVADMGSEGPSISEERLSAIMKDMKILRAIERMHEESDRLFFRLKKKYYLGDDKQTLMLERLLGFFDGANYRANLKKKINGLQKEVGIKHIGGNINLVTGLKSILSGMPVTVFKNDTERRSVLTTVQQEIDVLIDKEVNEEGG